MVETGRGREHAYTCVHPLSWQAQRSKRGGLCEPRPGNTQTKEVVIRDRSFRIAGPFGQIAVSRI